MKIRLTVLFALAAVISMPIAADEVAIGFTAAEVRIMSDHFAGTEPKGKGRKKAKGLPPGIAKNLARGKPLPPGIAKQTLPTALLQKLPPVRDGYERVIVAGKIVLVEVATQVIRDVLYDIVLD